ncbi:metallophosphoesterase [Chloracidobacterium sp. MS 40/45]|uniref:metallophosphoesterase n=1 Tax=Chloracidobacterium aggregatum TaxID=2851959 RepID=UPI001B8C5058|nr:metallophosphoesterase [Chloracidobacterium aggregatum]QUW00828.1 metallophosphoesterase [Chloracidobacterium sp. MS 40/45]
MRVFALGDPHLSFARPKPMHIFGEHWRNHADRIATAWSARGTPDDVLILAGDLSWAMRAEDVRPDLDWIARLPGRKLIIRGNHDYWWHSLAKVRAMADRSIIPLQATCFVLERVAFVGTRGWQCPGDEPSTDTLERQEALLRREKVRREYTAQDRKIYLREVGRLRLGLEAARQRRSEFDKLVVILHYPPLNARHEPSGFTELLAEYDVDWCVYGHLHGPAIATAFNGQLGRTRLQLVSADSLDFTPFQLDL